MASDKITSAVDSLIDHLMPNNPDHSEEQAQEQHDRHFRLVKKIIQTYDCFVCISVLF